MMKNAFLSQEAIVALQEAEASSDKSQKRTAEQIAAIYTHGHNILVSASAGSGKTFVMVERIIDKLLRGVEIKALFISTFTVKAANELKERLESKLNQALRQADNDQLRHHLSQQLVDLPLAAIGTMDAFTQTVVSTYGYLVGVSPQFRILTDKSEQDYLQDEVFQDLFTDYMSGQNRSLFEQLVRQFSSARKDSKGFQETVGKIYQFVQSTPNPRKWLKERFLRGAMTQTDLASLPKSLFDSFLEEIWRTADALEDLTQLEGYKREKADGKPMAAYQKHLTIIENLRLGADQCMEASDREAFVDLAVELVRILPSGNDVTVAGTKYPVFKDLHQHLSDWKHLKTVIQYQPQSLPMLKLLQGFMLDFQAQYLERKKAENSFEFADISHLAIGILEHFPDVRKLYQERFHEVMVDEYQDTNHTQEAMLELLSNGHNRFMVGDIKQSIYRFRQADPKLFQDKFQTYEQDSRQGQLILLKENFRSQIEVLEPTNAIFTRLMDEAVGEVTYDAKHQLVAGSEGQRQANPDHRTQYLIYDTDDEGEDQESLITKGEVELLVKEIIRLHQEEQVAFKDITLLVGSRSRNEPIVTAFEKHGIPLVTDGGEQTYLQALEVMVMLDTLRAISNPLNDYALVALLKSPMFLFDEDELARLSLQAKDMAFYQKLQVVVAGQGEHQGLIQPALRAKVERFMAFLTNWRHLSKLSSLHDLIWQIYQDRLYYDYVGAMPNGEKRQANLYALALRADGFEKTGFKGLPRFIAMIDRILKTDNDLAAVEVAAPKDAVSLMTIHKSKGLQFKYVFILNMDKAFDRRDEVGSFILSRDNGIGIKYLADMSDQFDDKLGLSRLPVAMETLPYQSNQRESRLARLSEQMRLLYVAMTRAEQKLYLVGKGSRQRLENQYSHESQAGRLPAEVREKMTSFQDWILGILSAFPSADLGMSVTYFSDADLTSDKIGKLEVKLPISPDDLTDNRQSEQIVRALDMMESVDKLNQKYDKAIKLPTVRTPSQIKSYYEPVMDIEGMDVIDKKPIKATFKLPTFDAKSQVNPVAVGSAVHELMQRLPLDKPITLSLMTDTLDAVSALPVVKEQLDLPKLLGFFDTDLGKLLQANSDKLYREAPFAILQKDRETGEDYVIRGIIDGYLKFEDKIVLFDYKTDRYQSILTIKERYRGQMGLYAQALRQSYGIEQVEAYLVLLGGEKVEIVTYDK